MKFTRHLHKKPEILLYDSSFSYQQVTQPWANSVTHTTRITRSKLPDAPTHSRLDFSTRHNPAGSLNHYATLTSQDHCTGFEGCQHPSSIATEHLEACCLLSQPFSYSLYTQLLWFQATVQNSFVCKSLSSNSAYRALLLVPGSSPNCCQEHTPSLCLSLLVFSSVPLNISTFCAL